VFYSIIKTLRVNNKYCYSSSWTLRNVSDKTCRECKDILCSIIFFENLAVYWIMWKNTVQRSRTQMTIWSRCLVCWITKATNTYSEYVILIAFPLRLWWHERSWMLCYTHIDILLSLKFCCQSIQKNVPFVHSRPRKIKPCYTAQFSVTLN